MAANGIAQKGQRHPDGHWGKWRGVTCAADGCEQPAKCKGLCMSHYNKQRWAEGHRPPSINSANRRRAHLRHRYGIDDIEYNTMLDQQCGVCAICRQPPDPDAHHGRLCVDHDHDTGRVRGLLCNDCNLAVGYGKSPEVLRAAAEYLQRHA